MKDKKMAFRIRRFGYGYLNEEAASNAIPGKYIIPEDSPYRDLSMCEVVEGPDGERYEINTPNGLRIKMLQVQKALGAEYPALSYFAAMLDTVFTFEVPTMATDGVHLFINPAFATELIQTTGSLGPIFVIMHELFHNLYLHIPRGKAQGFDMRKANIAGDYEINLAIEELVKQFKEIGITKKIGGLIDEKYDGQSFEEIYRILDKTQQEDPTMDDDSEDSDEIKLDPNYKDGYRDGWNKAIEEMRNAGLVQFVNESSIMNAISGTATGNSAMDPYKGGFNDGYAKAWETIKNLQKGGSGSGSGAGSSFPMPKVEQIDGLTPIKPNFKVNSQQSQQGSQGSSNNTPVEIDPSKIDDSPNNSSNGQGKGQFGEREYDKDGNVKNSANSSNDDQNQSGQQNGQSDNGQSGQQGGQEGGQQNGQSGQQDGQQGGQNGQSGQQGGQNGQSGQQGGRQKGYDPTSNMAKVDKISTGYGKGQTKYKNGQVVASSKKGQGDYGDLIPIEQGNKIAQKDSSWKKWKSHAGKTSNDVEKMWQDALKGERGRQLIDSLRSHGVGSAKTLQDMINEWEPPTQDWKKLLKKWLKGAYEEVVQKFPKKRKIDQDIYKKYNKKRGESGKDIIYMVDVSGSMSDDDLRDCLREINGIAEGVKVKRAYILQMDSEIHWDSIDVIKPQHKRDTRHALEVFTRRGMGGTDFDAPFEWVSNEFTEENGTPNCVIVMTDGGVDIPPKPKKWGDKIIWFIVGGYTGFDPGYGKVIYWKQ